MFIFTVIINLLKLNIMKKLYALLMMLPLLFAACNDNTSGGGGRPDGNSSIIGSWELADFDVVIEGTDQMIVDMLKQSLGDMDASDVLGESLTFNADGTFSDGDETWPYTYDGITLTQTIKEVDENGEEVTVTLMFKTVVSGNNLTMTMDMKEMIEEDTGTDIDVLGITKLEMVMKFTRK